MLRKRFTNEQIAFALRQAENGATVDEICRKMSISEPTFYRWKKRFVGMGVPEIRRPKQLEDVLMRKWWGPPFVARSAAHTRPMGYLTGDEIDFSGTGKPTNNAYSEAVDGRERAECLNASGLLSLADARERIQEWR